MSAIDTAPFSPQEIASEGIKPNEYEEIVSRLGRHPNKAELGMFGVMWSEHCCYKNSRPLLSQFPTTGPRVLVGPGENAGVVDMGDGLRLAFKVESHNHPSAVEPFQGAATGVGGILRDIFTMGARPIAILNSLRFGDLDDAKTKRLFQGVVAGISHYGNCVGVPTVGGEVYFDKAYSGNPLVNAMALGLMETPDIVKSGAKGIGNPVLYVGSTTGRDGMGGASFASAELTDESLDDRPAVQVGDPFLEKSLIEACLEAFKTGAVAAAQDMGAAGLTCSTAEMAEKGGVGVLLDLDKIPARETGMVPYEYLLSESQERMLFIAEKGREQELIDIFHKWELQAVVAGEVIAEPIVRIMFEGKVAAEVPASALSENTPIYHHDLMTEAPEYAQQAWAWTESQLPTCDTHGINGQSWNQVLLKLLDTPTIASKRWVYRQYDHQVQNNTVMFPGGADAAVVRVRPLATETSATDFSTPATNIGVAASTDCNPRYVYLNPIEGAKMAVAEAARNLSCVGAEPIAVTDNLNFGSPEKPIGYWQLANACTGISEACREFETPVTGGNVSLYNETLDADGQPQPIYPTPVIGMVGRVPDVSKVVGQSWQQSGDRIYLLGFAAGTNSANITLGASEYLAAIHDTIAGQPPIVDFDLERQVQAACRAGVAQGLIRSAHDCAEGGLTVALAESCIGSNHGADINLNLTNAPRLDHLLFAEGGARIVVSVAADQVPSWETHLKAHLPGAWQAIGAVGTAQGKLCIAVNGQTLIDSPVNELVDAWANAIDRRLNN
ncbi:phosphoribosylformylglycinamidine synthase subunit PurL [filamentous cyanobacterium LEGE 11480]|uniref:Phosphoribosylformylglycinamidine synthase subunit PurL n=1 Tax=Romeriopsis navalis LEGE 11480 TaxID=2777977 RepID=A0A928Z4Z7_9CYAN|nr:phosphoribosylformylglycinamidine synthase subunit PurL [Romeriopsis navalis]MBE9030933.1 phosphoribosylformylglycinamidine synthase subunit PurL [Romeriopsis navalis LEGE 11480]